MKKTTLTITLASVGLLAMGATPLRAVPGSMQKAPVAAFVDQETLETLPLIKELPEGGEKAVYYRSSQCFNADDYGVWVFEDSGSYGELVTYEDGSVYMKNPVTSIYPAPLTYIKGQLQDDAKTIRFSFPQVIEEYTGELQTGEIVQVRTFVERLERDYSPTVVNYVIPSKEEDNYIDLVINEDGTVTFKDAVDFDYGANFPSYILGATTIDRASGEESFLGMGDWSYTFEPFSGEAMAVPEGLTPTCYQAKFYQNVGKWSEDMSLLKVAFDGTDVYMWNLEGFPGSCVKGSYDEAKGEISFPVHQYLGLDYTTNHFAFLEAAVIDRTTNAEGSVVPYLKPEASLNFIYDTDYNALSTDQFMVVMGGKGTENELVDTFIIFQYGEPLCTYYDESVEPARPANPIWSNNYDDDDYGIWMVIIPKVDINGRLLDTEKLSYTFMLDDTAYYFSPYDHPSFKEEFCKIPYNYQSYESGIIFNGQLHSVLYYKPQLYDKLEVYSTYTKEDGTELRSDRVKFVPYDSVEEMAVAGEVSAEYYDLQGRRVAAPEAGLYVRVSVKADGSREASKQMIK